MKTEFSGARADVLSWCNAFRRGDQRRLRYRLLFATSLAASIGCAALIRYFGFAHEPVVRDAAVVFGSAFASSVAGFAFSAICGAFLFHDGNSPTHVVQIIMLSSIAIQSLSVLTFRHSITWRTLRTFLCGGAFGLPIGVFLLYHAPSGIYLRTMGTFLLGYGAYTLFRQPRVLGVEIPSVGVAEFAVGILGGITGGFAGFPGAFLTIWCSQRGWDKTRQRALCQPYILIMQVAAFGLVSASAQVARFRAPFLDVTALYYIPLALSGAYLGLRVFHRLSERQFAIFLSLTLIASGFGLLGAR